MTEPMELDIVQHGGGKYDIREVGPSREVCGDPVYVGSIFYVMAPEHKAILAYVYHDAAYCNDYSELGRAERAAFKKLAKRYQGFTVIVASSDERDVM